MTVHYVDGYVLPIRASVADSPDLEGHGNRHGRHFWVASPVLLPPVRKTSTPNTSRARRDHDQPGDGAFLLAENSRELPRAKVRLLRKLFDSQRLVEMLPRRKSDGQSRGEPNVEMGVFDSAAQVLEQIAPEDKNRNEVLS